MFRFAQHDNKNTFSPGREIMKALVIYDSFFGNTEKIARAICDALCDNKDVDVRRVCDVRPEQLTGLNLLIVGSPTRAFRPSPSISGFLKSIPANSLYGIKSASFDTRISPDDTNSRVLRFMVSLFGYAAKPISEKLRNKGAEIITAPEGFFVTGTEGPLKDGELEQAAAWAKKIRESLTL
jgi:flavodoxin I